MARPTRLLALVGVFVLSGSLTLGGPANADPTGRSPAESSGAAAAKPGLRTAVSFPTRTTTDKAGNTLLADATGRALQLRGVNQGKWKDITREDVAKMSTAGFTLLRLPIQWEYVEPTRGSYDAAYVQHIRNVLDWAQEYGLLVMVDWHQDVFGAGFDSNGAPAWATRTDGIEYEPGDGNWFENYFHPAVQAAFTHLWNDPDLQQAQADAWAHLAKQLRGHPALLGYDLFNEPMTGDIKPGDDLLAIGTKLMEFERTVLPQVYERLIAAVRSVDRRSWLWIEPTVVVGERITEEANIGTSLPAFDDPRRGADRIGYAPHAYSTEVEYGGDWDATSGWVASYERAITTYPRAQRMPVIVGEWGPISVSPAFPGNVKLVEKQSASFSRFATGWAIWYGCRNATGGGYCAFADEAGNLDEGRRAAWAPYPVALSGTHLKQRYRPGDYLLVYRPSKRRASTQIVVPSGFGERVSVRVVTAKGKQLRPRVRISKPTRTGARTVTIGGGQLRSQAKVQVHLSGR